MSMRMRRVAVCALGLLVLLPRVVMGSGEDSDLDLIPDDTPSASKEKTQQPESSANDSVRAKFFIDDALEGNFRRSSLPVPIPNSHPADLDNRLSIDGRVEIYLLPGFTFTFADRLNNFSDKRGSDYRDRVQNDLKEAYLTWNVYKSDFIDIGRVNVKEGVAMGFNPTDYFKKNAVSTRISEDTSVLRENRLGTVLAKAQRIWEKGAFSLLFSPKISDEQGKWWTDCTGAGLGLDRTNSSNRFLAKMSVNVWQDVTPEFLYFNDNGHASYGLNVTKGIGDSIVTYLEWSGSNRPDIIGQALQDAQGSGTFPPNMPEFLRRKAERRFRNQLAAGFSYTMKNNQTTYVEYHYNEAGFSRKDWRDWFDTGAGAAKLMNIPATTGTGQGILGQLWSIRGFAQDAQEPLNRHYLFIRTHWEDAFVKKLDLTGILQINLSNGSFFTQPMAEYHLNNFLTLALTLNFFVGSDRSEYGSLQKWGNIKGGVTYYF